MIITIVNVSAPESRGTYQFVEVVYKDDQGRVNNRKVMSFGKTAQTFKDIQGYSSGEQVEVQTVRETGKDGQPYNNWVAVGPVGSLGTAPAQEASPRPAANAAPAARSGGNFETPEERAKKQVYIVRQSSIGAAINLLSNGAKVPPNIDAVLNAAKQFENYVFGLDVPTSTVKDEVAEFDDFEDDIPL